MDRTIYLDNNATTMIAPEVLEAMLPFLKERYGNPSSMHSFGGSVARDVAQARVNVASFIGAEYDYEIVFTGTGTESDNMAIMGSLAYYHDKRHIITTRVEHPAVHLALQEAGKGRVPRHLCPGGPGGHSRPGASEKLRRRRYRCGVGHVGQ